MSLDQATQELQAVLTILREGHALLNHQIARLEAMLSSTGDLPKRRGRPPKALPAARTAEPAKRKPGRPRKNPEAVAAPAEKKRTKSKWSAAAREAARKRMQDYWAKKG